VVVTIKSNDTTIRPSSSADLAVPQDSPVTIVGTSEDSVAIYDLLPGANLRSGHFKKQNGPIIRTRSQAAIYRWFNTGKNELSILTNTTPEVTVGSVSDGCTLDLFVSESRELKVTPDAVGVYDRVSHRNSNRVFIVDGTIRPGHFDKPVTVVKIPVLADRPNYFLYRFTNTGKSPFAVNFGATPPLDVASGNSLDIEIKVTSANETVVEISQKTSGDETMGSYELLSVY
jgi:hypothetical protein